MTAKSWDEIDLGGLSMDISADGEAGFVNRQERYSAKDISTITETPGKPIKVTVQNLTSNKDSSGIILDISSGGAKILSQVDCHKSDLLRISLTVGKHLIVCRAKVSWIQQEKEGLMAGIQFISLKKEDEELIRSLPSALHLK